MSADLLSQLSGCHSASAGKVAVLNIDTIKARLGPRWDKVAGFVRAYLEKFIKASIKPGDMYFEVANLGYIVICRDLSVQETQLRCTTLAREICANLFGEENMEVEVRSIVGPIDRGMLQGSTEPLTAIENDLEWRGIETTTSLADCQPKVSAPASGANLQLNFSQMPHTCFQCPIDQISFVYRPIWDCTRDVILSYLCQPAFPGDFGQVAARRGGFCRVGGDDAHRAQFDGALLSHCARHMSALHKRGFRLVLGVPLHSTTLLHVPAWKEFSKTYRVIARDILRDIVFVITDLSDVPESRLVQELPKLSGARHILCEIECSSDAIVRAPGAGIHAIGFSLPTKSTNEKEVISRIKSLTVRAHENGCESFAFGVTSTSYALNAMAAGVRYLEGTAVHEIVNDPRAAFVHKVEDLFRGRIPNSRAG